MKNLKFIVLIFLFYGSFAFSQTPKKGEKKADTVDLKDFSIDLDILLAPYNYSAEERRNPFVQKSVEESLLEEGAVLTESQQYDVKNFKILGIIWNHCSNKSRECRALSKKSRVMLADPTNKIHSLKRGDRIGKRGAYIEEIREGEIVIIEPFRRKGKIYYRSFVLAFDEPTNKTVIGGGEQ